MKSDLTLDEKKRIMQNLIDINKIVYQIYCISEVILKDTSKIIKDLKYSISDEELN